MSIDINDVHEASMSLPSAMKEFRVVHLHNHDVKLVTRIEQEARNFHARMIDKDKHKVETLFFHDDGDAGDEHVERTDIKLEGGEMDVQFGEE